MVPGRSGVDWADESGRSGPDRSGGPCVSLGAGAASEADFTTCTPRPLRRSHQVLMQREHVSGLAPSALVQIEGETSRQKEEKWSGTEMDKRETLTASWEELEADWAKGFQIKA